MSKKRGHRPKLGEIWEHLSKEDREFLLDFARYYSLTKYKNLHMGMLALVSVGRYFDWIKSPNSFIYSAQETRHKARAILRNAIRAKRKELKS